MEWNWRWKGEFESLHNDGPDSKLPEVTANTQMCYNGIFRVTHFSMLYFNTASWATSLLHLQSQGCHHFGSHIMPMWLQQGCLKSSCYAKWRAGQCLYHTYSCPITWSRLWKQKELETLCKLQRGPLLAFCRPQFGNNCLKNVINDCLRSEMMCTQNSNGHNLWRTANTKWLYLQQCAYTQPWETSATGAEGIDQADNWTLERERTGQPLLYGKFQGILHSALSRQALSSQKSVEKTHSRMCHSLYHGRIKG